MKKLKRERERNRKEMRDKGKFCFVNLKHVCLFTENEKIRIAKKKKKIYLTIILYL